MIILPFQSQVKDYTICPLPPHMLRWRADMTYSGFCASFFLHFSDLAPPVAIHRKLYNELHTYMGM